MKRRIFAAMAAGALMMSLAGTFSADEGDVPNANACFGQGTSHGASNPNAGGVGLNPRERADLYFGGSVQLTQSEDHC